MLRIIAVDPVLVFGELDGTSAVAISSIDISLLTDCDVSPCLMIVSSLDAAFDADRIVPLPE